MLGLDFHLHSRVSDGRLSPGDVVRLAHESAAKVIALTDHDNTDGVNEAQLVGAELGIRVIPGIELSADAPGASIHILGLFLDYQQPAFQEQLTRFRSDRLTRAKSMVDTLDGLGAHITLERVFELAGEGTVGRPHIAQALLEAGHVQSIPEAFDLYLARGKPAYFEGFRLEPSDAISLIHSVGGLAAWAHPYELDGKDWLEYLPLLLDAGVDGLEVFYGKEYGPDAIPRLLEACDEYGLVPTVGSDYHGFKGLERAPGSVDAPEDLLERLEARAASRRDGASPPQP